MRSNLFKAKLVNKADHHHHYQPENAYHPVQPCLLCIELDQMNDKKTEQNTHFLPRRSLPYRPAMARLARKPKMKKKPKQPKPIPITSGMTASLCLH